MLEIIKYFKVTRNYIIWFIPRNSVHFSFWCSTPFFFTINGIFTIRYNFNNTI